MTNADVVVIGGGVNGVSTAFNLASLGVRRVTVVERRYLAAGATGKSGSLVRMHYTNEAESRLALESLKVFRDFANIVGGDCGFDASGFVEVVGPEHAKAMAANVAMQQGIGIDTRLVSKEELHGISPDMRVDDIGAAAYEPGSGFADPNATTFAFAAAARRLGVTIETGCEALRIVTEGGRVAGVETSGGRISAPVVVAVPGAWAGRLLDPLGLDFGLTPYRIQVSIFRWPDAAFARSTMRGGWAGMIMMSSDGRPIIDQVPSVPGLWVMLGDSGTSFKTSPAIGRCLAEWIVKGKPETADLSRFRSTRFAEGKPWVDDNSYGIDTLTISR